MTNDRESDVKPELMITGTGELYAVLRLRSSRWSSTAPQILGSKPYDHSAEALADHARYAGFSAVVIPVATWLDLPKEIREAIFGSHWLTGFVLESLVCVVAIGAAVRASGFIASVHAVHQVTSR